VFVGQQRTGDGDRDARPTRCDLARLPPNALERERDSLYTLGSTAAYSGPCQRLKERCGVNDRPTQPGSVLSATRAHTGVRNFRWRFCSAVTCGFIAAAPGRRLRTRGASLVMQSLLSRFFCASADPKVTSPASMGAAAVRSPAGAAASSPDAVVCISSGEDEEPDSAAARRAPSSRGAAPKGASKKPARKRLKVDAVGASSSGAGGGGGGAAVAATAQGVRAVRSRAVSEGSGVKLTPLEQQVVSIRAANPGVVLLVECGYKFRLFGPDATLAARHLGIMAVRCAVWRVHRAGLLSRVRGVLESLPRRVRAVAEAPVPRLLACAVLPAGAARSCLRPSPYTALACTRGDWSKRATSSAW
jgi:hypothetical protein